MSASLPRVGFAKADNPNSPFDRRETQDVQPSIQVSDGHETRLRVVVSVIGDDNGVGPPEISGALKWQLPFGLVPGTLFGVKFDSHDLIVVTIKLAVNAQISMDKLNDPNNRFNPTRSSPALVTRWLSGAFGRVKEESMIRVYRETDWGQVCVIYDLAKPDEMKGLVEVHDIKPLAQDGQMLRYFVESQIWVYESNGSILGFIGRKNDVVSWLFVHPDHRRKGVARRLLNELIRIHDGPLRLNMTKSNRPATVLYESLGFEVYEEFQGNMYGRRIPAVRMRRTKDTRAEQAAACDRGTRGA